MDEKYIKEKMKRIKQNLTIYTIVALILPLIFTQENIIFLSCSILIINAIYFFILLFIENKIKKND